MLGHIVSVLRKCAAARRLNPWRLGFPATVLGGKEFPSRKGRKQSLHLLRSNYTVELRSHVAVYLGQIGISNPVICSISRDVHMITVSEQRILCHNMLLLQMNGGNYLTTCMYYL